MTAACPADDELDEAWFAEQIGNEGPATEDKSKKPRWETWSECGWYDSKFK